MAFVMGARRYFVLLLLGSVAAFDLGLKLSPALEQKRSVVLAGGWGTNQQQACPAGSTQCGVYGCCPNELTFVGTDDPDNVACCSGDDDCQDALQNNPVCADSSWSLWNSTTQGQYGGFFCCVGDQVGDIGGNCNAKGAILQATSQAISLVPTGQGATPTSAKTSSTVVSASTTGTDSVPSLVLESISTGPPTPSSTHSPIPSYTGGPLLQGYCATPEFVLLDGPTAYWAPAIGCVDDKTDCCPYAVAKSTAGLSATVVTVVSTTTVNIGPGGTTQQGPYTGFQAFPPPASSNAATLSACPADYHTVSGGCCPSGYQLWNAPLAGQVPCYSSLSSFLVPPAVPVTSVPAATSAAAASASASASVTQKPTSAIVNVVFALQFTVKPAISTTTISLAAKAGIGAGAGVAVLAILALGICLCCRRRRRRNQREGRGPVQYVPAEQTNGYGYGYK